VLLPSPPVDLTARGEDAWHLRYERAGVDPTWLTSVSRELGTDVALLSGLIEQVGGELAGRAVVSIDPSIPDQRVIAAFAARGIHAARHAQPAAELPAPLEVAA
jgi:ABC-type methionine transport system ATPase subunit